MIKQLQFVLYYRKYFNQNDVYWEMFKDFFEEILLKLKKILVNNMQFPKHNS